MIDVQQPRAETRVPSRKRGGRQPAASKKTTSIKSFEFVESDPSGRAPAERRKFIRSHVMRGKNTSKRVERVPDIEQPSWLNAETDEPPSENHAIPNTTTTPDSRLTPLPSTSYVVVENPDDEARRAFVFLPSCFLGPVRPPPDLSLFVFPEQVDDSSRYLIRRFFTNVKEAMYPTEWCVKFDLTKVCWFRWLLDDAAYFHSLLFTVSAFQDIINSGPEGALSGQNLSTQFSRRTQLHLRRSMELLRESIQDRDRQMEDVTAAVVVSMAMMADAIGDDDACEAHVNGLREMVRLRGGMKAFSHNRQLQIKISRVDLGWSIKNNSKPLFFDGNVSWSRFFDKIILNQIPAEANFHRAVIDALLQDLDTKLQHVFCDLRDFTRTANMLITSKDKLQPELFQEIMVSIQYRLLLLEYPLASQSLEAAIRNGLLAFEASIFLQVPGMKIKYPAMTDRLRFAIDVVNASTPAFADLKLWLLFIGSISFIDSTELWLISAIIELTGEYDWPEIRDRLKGIMWIDAVHDGPGKKIFEATRTARDLGDKQPWTMGI